VRAALSTSQAQPGAFRDRVVDARQVGDGDRPVELDVDRGPGQVAQVGEACPSPTLRARP